MICDIYSLSPHKVSEVACMNCCCRWIATRPKQTLLKELECPHCGEHGYAIETGEVLENDTN